MVEGMSGQVLHIILNCIHAVSEVKIAPHPPGEATAIFRNRSEPVLTYLS